MKRLADGELVALCDSYYPAGLAQGTQIAQDRIRSGVRAVIEDPAGPVRRRIARSFDDLTSRAAGGGRAAVFPGRPGHPGVRHW
jgi:GntR family transcriptional regulator